jgi:hypothetical protein
MEAVDDDDLDLTELQAMPRDRLEALWEEPREPRVPQGVYWGHVLQRMDHPTARRPFWRWIERVGFEWTPFGVDFDRGRWFFFDPALGAGRFDARPGPSRWRDTQAVGLHYEVSALPGPVRRRLYDEVKPLSERWLLGIGGIAAPRGVGDHFFFALERARLRPQDPDRADR